MSSTGPERPAFDSAYGISASAEGLLPWSFVAERMERSRNYWVCTTRPDGRPHVMPVWGVWVGETLFFSTGETSIKARNLAADPRLVVHLESGDEAVILEGVAERRELGSAAHSDVVGAYAAKYDMDAAQLPGPDGWYTLRPATAFAWLEADYPGTATRFRL